MYVSKHSCMTELSAVWEEHIEETGINGELHNPWNNKSRRLQLQETNYLVVKNNNW